MDTLHSAAGSLDEPLDAPPKSDRIDRDDLSDQLDLILEEAKERSVHIENGEYHELEEWDECGRYGEWGYLDDDCPDVLTEELRDELKATRSDADDALLDADDAYAGAVFKHLIHFEHSLRTSCDVMTDNEADRSLAHLSPCFS